MKITRFISFADLKKHRVLYCAVIVFLVVIVLLGIFSAARMLLNAGQPYKDLNGPDDSALNTITLQDVLTKNNDYTVLASGISSHGSATGITGELVAADRATRSFSAQKINGILTLQATKAPAESLTLELSSTLESGNAEIFILVDGQLHSRLPANEAHTVTLETVAGQTVLVKLAAEDARLYATVTRK